MSTLITQILKQSVINVLYDAFSAVAIFVILMKFDCFSLEMSHDDT